MHEKRTIELLASINETQSSILGSGPYFLGIKKRHYKAVYPHQIIQFAIILSQ